MENIIKTLGSDLLMCLHSNNLKKEEKEAENEKRQKSIKFNGYGGILRERDSKAGIET